VAHIAASRAGSVLHYTCPSSLTTCRDAVVGHSLRTGVSPPTVVSSDKSRDLTAEMERNSNGTNFWQSSDPRRLSRRASTGTTRGRRSRPRDPRLAQRRPELGGNRKVAEPTHAPHARCPTRPIYGACLSCLVDHLRMGSRLCGR
jgi:hypothetical protein